jgi:hypothetical protein
MGVVTAAETRLGIAVAASPARASGRLAAGWRILALTLFAGWILAVGAYHEPWFDESQAWLLARDSSLSDLLLHRVRYEGSPGLWHALLWLAIRAGLPFAQFHLIAAACAVAGAAVVLWRAPFPPAVRLAILGSYVFAYQYAVVARSYSLDLLLIPLLAACHADRVARPWRYALLIALIANANAHGFFAAAVVGAEFAWAMIRAGRWREPQALGALALALAGGLFALLTTLPPADGNFLATGEQRERLMSALHFVLDAMIDRLRPWRSDLPAPWELALALYASAAMMATAVIVLRQRATLLLAAAIGAALLGFSAAVYSSPWQSGLLFLFWIFCLWVAWPAAADERSRRIAGGILLLVCLAQFPQAVATGLRDRHEDYSSSRRAAGAIAQWRADHPGGRIAALGSWAFAAQPYFTRNIFANYHGGAPQPAYLIWSRSEPWQPTMRPDDWALALAARPDLILVSLKRIGPGPWASFSPCPEGYRPVQVFSAEPWWRGRRYADDDLVLLERRPTIPGSACLVTPDLAANRR